MFKRLVAALRKNALALLGGALLLLALFAAYANHFHNSFHFDDAHTIVTNGAIRELRNIPVFFRDATTFSALPSNQSYRPLVSTLLAIDYWLGGGVHPFWFHVSIFTLFVALTLLLAFVIKKLLDETMPSAERATAVSDRGYSDANLLIGIGAAALYGLHAANADTVNYIIASSEVVSTLGVIASFAVYFAFPGLRRYYVYVLPAAIAILAKPPAAIFAVLFAIYRLLFPEDCSHGPVGCNRSSGIGPLHTRLRSPRRPTARQAETRLQVVAEIVVPFLVCSGMLLLVQHMTPRNWIAGAANTHNYLITQPYVALLYVKTFFWPSGLSADYDLNPFTTTDDPRFWAGFAFVTLFIMAAIAAAIFKKTRIIGFGLLWFFIGLLPTSLFPLAEPMNDHRTFLPYIGLVIAMAGALSLLINRDVRYSLWAKLAAAVVVGLFLCGNGYATFQRNKVWRTEETLWHDVVTKSPRNPRGLMNYGNTLMARGDYEGALDYFHRALALAPQYSVLLINLAIAENATNQSATAEQHFKDALRLAPTSPDSYTYYGRYLLSHSRAAEARAFLRSALELSPTDLTAHDLLGQAESQTSNQPATQTAESYLALSLQRYGEERYVESIAACRAALELRPNYAEAWNNICAAYNKLGGYEEAAAACEQALGYKPDFELARNNLRFAQEMMAKSRANKAQPGQPSR